MSILAHLLALSWLLMLSANPPAERIIVENGDYFPRLEAFHAEHFSDVASARAYFSGNTFRTYDDQHGTQVEYLSNSGWGYLWYPGNKCAVPSRWKLVLYEKIALHGKRRYQAGICFMYSPRSYNPVTKEHGGEWECSYARDHSYHTVERILGDPFLLRNGLLPPVALDREDRSFAWIAEQLNAAIPFRYLPVEPR